MHPASTQTTWLLTLLLVGASTGPVLGQEARSRPRHSASTAAPKVAEPPRVVITADEPSSEPLSVTPSPAGRTPMSRDAYGNLVGAKRADQAIAETLALQAGGRADR